MRDLFGERGVLANGVDIAGVDEVGRGPLAGPVVAGAVVLDPAHRIKGLKDSKELDPNEREELAALIRERAIAWALGRAEVAEIDRINILRATLVAMRRAVEALTADVRVAYIDGNTAPMLPDCAAVTVVGGDATVPAISAASIIAKVARDEEMIAASASYPGYGFECHKGYATASHLAALRELGPTPLHRRSFAPVEDACARQTQLFADVTP
ncbi:MAG: ribonuclease HII [Gammaproteobacteria bacterium]|nr:ribonuclease HII [Gammaproteobacteria bacterium]